MQCSNNLGTWIAALPRFFVQNLPHLLVPGGGGVYLTVSCTWGETVRGRNFNWAEPTEIYCYNSLLFGGFRSFLLVKFNLSFLVHNIWKAEGLKELKGTLKCQWCHFTAEFIWKEWRSHLITCSWAYPPAAFGEPGRNLETWDVSYNVTMCS